VPVATFFEDHGDELSGEPAEVFCFLREPGAIDLLRVYAAIPDEGPRREIVALVRSTGRLKARKRGKEGRQLWIPCTDALKAALDAAPRRATTILTKPDGTPWTKSAFQHQWSAAFTAAGITDDLHFHDLRGTAVTMLSEAGADP
jgi:integrase